MDRPPLHISLKLLTLPPTMVVIPFTGLVVVNFLTASALSWLAKAFPDFILLLIYSGRNYEQVDDRKCLLAFGRRIFCLLVRYPQIKKLRYTKT